MGRFFVVLFWLGWLSSAAAQSASGVIWGYDGRFGPENWAEINSDYAQCGSGMQQSPIDIRDPIETTLIPLEFYWDMPDWELENIGPSMVMRATAAGQTHFDDVPFQLVQIYFRMPSEHRINGTQYPMEVQLMHIDGTGQVAGLSIMIKGGGRNETFDRIFGQIPRAAGMTNTLSNLDLIDLLTDVGDLFRYRGSLTHPPCSENVQWTVLKDPLSVSHASLLAFETVFGTNARPLQETNRRYVLTD